MQWTPLSYAIETKSIAIVALLLERGADPNAAFVCMDVGGAPKFTLTIVSGCRMYIQREAR